MPGKNSKEEKLRNLAMETLPASTADINANHVTHPHTKKMGANSSHQNAFQKFQ